MQGIAGSTSGQSFSFWGRNYSSDGTGVFGEHFAVTGVEPGVLGRDAFDDQRSRRRAGRRGAHLAGRELGRGPGDQRTERADRESESMARRPVAGGASMGRRCPVWGSEVWQRDPSGVGVRAIGSGTDGTALGVSSGAIRVFGASFGTDTPVFVHQAVSGNTCTADGGANSYTVIDNPFANGDPSAILIVTSRGIVGLTFAPPPIRGVPGDPCGVPDRWAILWDPAGFFGETFNVLVIKS